MQNAPAMLAQKMMNRQAAYAPVGMVSQNMSGNKKGGGAEPSKPVIGLKFDTTTATAGVTFSNSDTTATNGSGSSTASAKANAAVIPNTGNYWYWEFIIGGSPQQLVGFGLPSFVCNTTNQIGLVTSSVGYLANNGQLWANGGVKTTTTTAAIGDVIGFKLQVFNPGSFLTVLKNGIEILSNFDISVWIADNTTAWTPVFSSNSTSAISTISNNIYSYAGYTPIGSSATRIAVSASVPAIADGAYDVYTFNASGTFTATSTGAVRALVIAGGGAGGQTYGGGGAGGYQEKGATVTPQTYTVTVGAGGAGQAFTGSDQSLVSNNGNNSVFSAITSTGGGGGGAYSNSTATSARTGGSGGGGSLVLGGNVSGAAGTTGQGFAGGNAAATGNAGGGGGGGASAVGDAGATTGGGNGGAGVSSNITGTSVTRAGGGGGSFFSTGGTIGTGGAGGGGAGASTGINAAGVGVAGSANTGGGAGGSHSDGLSSTSASGGSGIVIIRVRARA